MAKFLSRRQGDFASLRIGNQRLGLSRADVPAPRNPPQRTNVTGVAKRAGRSAPHRYAVLTRDSGIPGQGRRMNLLADLGGTLICLAWLILFWWAALEK
jgi:hypothetical protein